MKTIKEMTVKEKIGQLVWVGFSGYEFNDNLKYLIDEYKVGNIILFTRNIKDIKQLFELNKKIHEYILEKTGIMPFISIDQEGGMVTRIMDQATFCPGNMTLATSDCNNAYKIGQIMGEELRALGINMNLAPSLDVNNNPNNPVIGVRSYSDNPDVVSKYGINYIRGLQETGVIATAKHFPGHGDTESDSHKSLPLINHDKERLEKIELVPFKNAINEVKAIMTAHVLFPAYEEDNLPATLSKKVVTDLLRNRLGYNGLITSDCMEMKAIDDHYTTEKGCVMGLLAGLDQVMVSATFDKQVKAFDLIMDSYNKNELTMEMIDEKVNRILNAKNESFVLMNKYFYGKEFNEIFPIVCNDEHKALNSKIVDESLTKVSGDDLYLNEKTLVIATEPFATTIAEDELNVRSITKAIIDGSKTNDLLKNCDCEPIKVSIDEEEINRLVNKAKGYKQVLVCTYNANLYQKQALLVNKLFVNTKNLYVISTRSPYDVFKFKQIKNYLCLYEYTPNSVNTIIKYLKGEIKPVGRLPIKLSEQIKVGASLYVGLKDYPLEKNIEYLNLLKKNKIEYVFVSAHMPEMDKGFYEELVKICDYANELGLKVCLDVSKPMMNNFTLPKIYSLRLDYGFSLDEIIEMSNDKEKYPFKIELNASTISLDSLYILRNKGANLSDLRISHNFYPKKYTGLSSTDIIEKNKEFHKLGMKVMIYIPSQNQKRMPMYEGLPSAEDHRDLNLYSILSTVNYLEADEIFFGDAYASEEELKLASKFDFFTPVIPIMIDENISVEEKQLLKKLHHNRIDCNEYFIRSSTRSAVDILPLNNIKRKKYDVTIDNSKFRRYQGEVCIMKKDLEADERVNIVGKALINDLVINAIKGGMSFRFIIVGEYQNEK